MSALVMLHGMLGAPSSFDAVRAAFPHHRVLAPYLPGHGPTPRGVFAWPDAIDSLVADLTAEVGSAPFDLVGYSLGARLALGICARHPNRVRRALLASVHPGLPADADRATRRTEDEAMARLVETRGLPALVDAWEDKPLFDSQRMLPTQLLAAQRAARLAHTPAGIAATFRRLGLGQMPDLSATIFTQRMRIKIVVGAEDQKFIALADSLTQRAPSLAIERIPGVGHNLFLEAPARLAPSMSAFFTEHAATIDRPPEMESPR